MPRIPPLAEAEWDSDVRAILDRGAPGEGRLGDHNIFPTFARHPDLFRNWLRFGGYLLSNSAFSDRDRELLILRTAYNCRSDYEWGQHARIGRACGLDDADLRRVLAGPDAEGWSAGEQTLLRAADELHADAKISPVTWSALAAALDERALIELPMLVGHYHLVAFTLNSLEVELDDGLEGLP